MRNRHRLSHLAPVMLLVTTALLFGCGRQFSMIAPGGVIQPIASTEPSGHQHDFPSLHIAGDGTPYIAYVEFDGEKDILRLAAFENGEFRQRDAPAPQGSIHQPVLAEDGAGTLWCVWSQFTGNRWQVLAKPLPGDGAAGETLPVSGSTGNHIFPDAKTDRSGRLWIAWQCLDGGPGSIYARYYDPLKRRWSEEIPVTRDEAGGWEPRLAFTSRDEAFIVFDSFREGRFGIWLASVPPNGQPKSIPIVTGSRYLARADAEASPDGKGLWVAYEQGAENWGGKLGAEFRQEGGGLHYDRRLFLALVDPETGRTLKIMDASGLIPGLTARKGERSSGSICLPEIAVDGMGDPWLMFRYTLASGNAPASEDEANEFGYWQTAIVRYDVSAGAWSKARTFSCSNYVLDRRVCAAFDSEGTLFVVYPGDNRSDSQQRNSRIWLAGISTEEAAAFTASQSGRRADSKPDTAEPTPAAQRSPGRQGIEDRPRWRVGEGEYTLVWGDLHRHSDLSVCQLSDDGSIVEQYRYAYDIAGLDFLAVTDHLEYKKIFTDYEWWQSQKLADMFQNPGFFLTFYGYEREQPWPNGHRNVIFSRRGGPIVYRFPESYVFANRSLPVRVEEVEGNELSPDQLWRILADAGVPALTMAHTPGSIMGADWSLLDQIDARFETLVEIYNGSRKSYEDGEGQYENGTYMSALKQGHKLGVFAGSDHRSTNTSFSGVYVNDFTRDGVFQGMAERRTIAATDRIIMRFSANDHVLGEVFTTQELPTMHICVEGTAPLQSVELIRNETVYRKFETGNMRTWEVLFTDETPIKGENRYYLRVRQADGNMGWTSPIWLTYDPDLSSR